MNFHQITIHKDVNGHVMIGPKTTAKMIGQTTERVFQRVTERSKIFVKLLVGTAVGEYIY